MRVARHWRATDDFVLILDREGSFAEIFHAGGCPDACGLHDGEHERRPAGFRHGGKPTRASDARYFPQAAAAGRPLGLSSGLWRAVLTFSYLRRYACGPF